MCLKRGRLGVLNKHRTLWIALESTPMSAASCWGYWGNVALQHKIGYIVHCNKFIHSQRDEITVYKNLFSPLQPNTIALPAPMIKANKLLVTELERLVNFQMGIMRYYVDIVLNQ